MNYRLVKIDPIELSILIEWEDGLVLNHAIPTEYIRVAINRLPTLIRERADITPLMDYIIQKERT